MTDRDKSVGKSDRGGVKEGIRFRKSNENSNLGIVKKIIKKV